MSLMTAVYFLIGVSALVIGAEALVRGAAKLAARTGLSPVVIGLTVVAFGTSAPELAVSMNAALNDKADLAVGNVVGSNVANVLLVLGISAIVGGGLVVARRLIRIDIPLVIGASLLLWYFSSDHSISRWEGGVLFFMLIAYVVGTVAAQLRTPEDPDLVPDELGDIDLDAVRHTSVWVDLGLVVAGLVGLVLGSSALVEAAVEVAEALGVSELVIGLTVVAIGTSLPEVATSVMAAIRGERDLAVGNAIGSNLFNILAVLGAAGLLAPSAIPVSDGMITIDLPVMVTVAVACLPIFAIGYTLDRWEGFVFLGFYAAYLVWLVLDAADHPIRTQYSHAILYFALPLTALTFMVIGLRYVRRGRSPAPN